MEFQSKALDLFIQTALERHRIYIKKEQGLEKPWTDDPIFQNYFFCNVFRQYDKCSKWIIENIIPYERLDMIILYRFISTYEIFKGIEEMGIPYDNFKEIEFYLKHLKKIQKNIFNGCFIRNPRIPGSWTETYKVPFVIIEELKKYNFEEKWKNQLQNMEDFVKNLQVLPATKGFMAYEYVCDLEYTSWFNPIDKYTWCNKGPGAERGLSLVCYGTRNAKFKSKSEWRDLTMSLFSIMSKEFAKEFPQEDFSMREVEHWLCEFQKYIKYKRNYKTGLKVKHRKYNGVD